MADATGKIEKKSIPADNQGSKVQLNKESVSSKTPDLIVDAVLAEGSEVPVARPIKEEYLSSSFVSAKFNSGEIVHITVDNNNIASAYIVIRNDRNRLLPNGHYEVLDKTIYRLPLHSYQLTYDRSMLLSVYNGQVINYLPRLAVLNGDFVKFMLDK